MPNIAEVCVLWKNFYHCLVTDNLESVCRYNGCHRYIECIL